MKNPRLAGWLILLTFFVAAGIANGLLLYHYPRLRASEFYLSFLIVEIVAWLVVLVWPGRKTRR